MMKLRLSRRSHQWRASSLKELVALDPGEAHSKEKANVDRLTQEFSEAQAAHAEEVERRGNTFRLGSAIELVVDVDQMDGCTFFFDRKVFGAIQL